MADPRYPPGPYNPGAPSPYPPQNMSGMMPGGPGRPPPQQQTYGPGFYPPQHQRPGFQGGGPIPQQPHFNGPPQPMFQPTFNNSNSSLHNTHAGFNSPRPGPAGPMYGGGPNGPGGFGNPGGVARPGFGHGPGPGHGPGHGPGYGPGTPPPQHAVPPMHPPPQRYQEWPAAGRPPSTHGYPPSSGSGYSTMPMPGPGPGSGPGPGPGPSFATKPYPPPSMPQPNLPFNGQNPTRPHYNPNMNPPAPSHTPTMSASALPTPRPSEPPSAFSSMRPNMTQPNISNPISNPNPAPVSAHAPAPVSAHTPAPVSAHTPAPVSAHVPALVSASVSAPVSNPLSTPQQTAYVPKTVYQPTAAASPKKDTVKSAMPAASPSTNHGGYHQASHQLRPPIYSTESHDADDRPTELIPIDEEPSSASTSRTPSLSSSSKSGAAAYLQSAPVVGTSPNAAGVSPSMSSTPISYLATAQSASDLDSRPSEILSQDIVKLLESPQKNDSIMQPSISNTSSPVPAPGIKFQPVGTFVPSTTYIPNKKETPKVSSTPTSSGNSGSYDPTVKVEISDLKPPNKQGSSLSASDSVKVALSDMRIPAIARQQSDASLDSPISLDGLMESIEAMARPTSSSPLSSSNSNVQQSSSADYPKPLPPISDSESEQKRYSLADAPVGHSNSSQSPPVSRLVPKRPTSSYLSPPSSASHGQTDPIVSVSSTPTSSNFTSSTPHTTPTNQPFFPPPQTQRQEETLRVSAHQPTTQTHPPYNHNHLGGDAMLLFNQPEFVHNPITSMAAFADRPVQKAPSMVRRAKTLRRAAGVTGATPHPETSQGPPQPPVKVTPDELYPYLLRLILLAQADEAPAPAPTPALPVTNKDTHKDLVKALRAKVKDILSGRDQNPAYQDPVVKRALTNMEPKQFKNSTNAEELMISFSIEMSRIQQTMNIPTNNRDAQISIMANLLRDAIQQDPFVGHEAILQRLDKQVKTTAVKPNNSTAHAEELTKVIKELFRHLEAVRHQRMSELRRNSTKQVAIEDLKKCASNLDMDTFPYPGIADYHHKEHHEEFKNRERAALNGMIRVLSAGHPTLATFDMPKRQFHSSEFVFIPQNPKAYYHLLLEMCVDHALATRGENDPASNLLSTPTRALLIDCGVRWRLTSSWREIMLMEVIKERYRDGKIPVHFLLDFLQSKFYKDGDIHQWHISEVNMLGDVYGGLNHMIFDNINHDIKDLDSVTAAYFEPMLSILDRVHQQEVYQRLNIDLTPFFEDIKETILLESIRSYNLKDEEVQKERYENETVPLTKMALYIVSEHGVMKKRFPKPLLGAIDVAAIVVENSLRNYVPLMQNMANMDARKLPMADVFPLYQLCRELVTLFELYAPSSSAHFNISIWFRPYVLKYLETLDTSISDWVTAAIKQDQFEEVSVGAGHSSSASDLFAFFYEPLTWVKGLNWPDDYQRATFMSSLAKVFCKAVDLYAQFMETMFNECMPTSVSTVASTEVKSLSEQLASFTFRSESAEAKKAAQFVFTPKMCVLVNNIEAVRQRLDELYRNMEVDEMVQILREHEPENESDPSEPHQFEIVFVCAERLLPMDSNEASDPFIVLSHESKDLFRSKTIYANINPHWNEVYEVTLTKEVTYLVRIYDSDKVHKNRLCGWQHLSIDPQDYEDYMPHDVWLDLSQVGRLLLRITMRGERDDIQFFFGRTFRSLKRKEADMSGMIVDAMIPSAQACLTEKVLFNNFRSKALFPFFGSSVSSAKVTKVSDEDCDNALGSLIDYLEASLPVLYDYLTTEGMTMVITKLWKGILTTIESLLMPPLSNVISDRTPLTEIEMHVVFKIIEFIKLYLNGGDAGDGFPLKVLEIPKYRDLLTVRPIYDSSAEDLMSEYNRALTVPGRGRPGQQQSDTDRRYTAAAKRPGADSMTPNPETVLRILRMRHEDGVDEFLRQAIETQSKAREARAQAKREQMAYQRQIMRDQNE